MPCLLVIRYFYLVFVVLAVASGVIAQIQDPTTTLLQSDADSSSITATTSAATFEATTYSYSSVASTSAIAAEITVSSSQETIQDDRNTSTTLYVQKMDIEVRSTTNIVDASNSTEKQAIDTSTEVYATSTPANDIVSESSSRNDNAATAATSVFQELLSSTTLPPNLSTANDAENTVQTSTFDKVTTLDPNLGTSFTDSSTAAITDTTTELIPSATRFTDITILSKNNNNSATLNNDESGIEDSTSTTAVVTSSTASSSNASSFIVTTAAAEDDDKKRLEQQAGAVAAEQVGQKLRKWYSLLRLSSKCAPDTMYDETLHTCVYPRQMFAVTFEPDAADSISPSLNLTFALQLLNNMPSVLATDSVWSGLKFTRLANNAASAMSANFDTRRNATELYQIILSEICFNSTLRASLIRDEMQARNLLPTDSRCYFGNTPLKVETKGVSSKNFCNEPSIRTKCTDMRAECFSDPQTNRAERELYPCECPLTRVFDGTICQPAFTYIITVPTNISLIDDEAFNTELSLVRSVLTAGSSTKLRITSYTSTPSSAERERFAPPKSLALRERISPPITSLNRRRRQTAQTSEQRQFLIASTNDVSTSALAHLFSMAFGVANSSDVIVASQDPCSFSITSCPAAHVCVPPLDTAANRWPFFCHCAADYIAVAQPLYYRNASSTASVTLFGNEQVCAVDICSNSTYCGAHGKCRNALQQQNFTIADNIETVLMTIHCDCADGFSGPQCSVLAPSVLLPVANTELNMQKNSSKIAIPANVVEGFCENQRCSGHGDCYTVRRANGSLHDKCVCDSGYTGVYCDENELLHQGTTVAFLIILIMFIVVIVALSTALIIVSILKWQTHNMLNKLTVRRHSGISHTMPSLRNGCAAGKSRHPLPDDTTHRRFSRPDLVLTPSYPSTVAPGVPHDILDWFPGEAETIQLAAMPQSPMSQNFATHFTTFRRQPSSNHYQAPLQPNNISVTQSSGNFNGQVANGNQQLLSSAADAPPRGSIYVQSRSGTNLNNLHNENVTPNGTVNIGHAAVDDERTPSKKHQSRKNGATSRRSSKVRSISDASQT